MRPLFMIHAGEYLVATHIEETFPKLRVWIPTKDIGVDLLITDAQQTKIASLQVKFSKDYIASKPAAAAPPDIAFGGVVDTQAQQDRKFSR